MALSEDTKKISYLAEVLKSLPEAMNALSASHGHKPVQGAPGLLDIQMADDTDLGSDVLAHSQYLLGVAGDHMEALRRSVGDRTLAYSPFSIARSAFELTATSSWITKSDIDLKERFARNLTLLLINSDEQIKLINASGYKDEEELQEGLEQPKERREELESIAAKIGIEPKPNKSGKTLSFVDGDTSVTGRIESTFGRSIYYRLVSTGAHQPLSMLGALNRAATPIEGFSEMLPDFEKIYWVIGRTVDWYAKAWWERWLLMGWPTAEVSEQFELAYDTLRLNESERHWR